MDTQRTDLYELYDRIDAAVARMRDNELLEASIQVPRGLVLNDADQHTIMNRYVSRFITMTFQDHHVNLRLAEPPHEIDCFNVVRSPGFDALVARRTGKRM